MTLEDVWVNEGYEVGKVRASELCHEYKISLKDYYNRLKEYKRSIGIEIEDMEDFDSYLETVRKKALKDPEWARVYTSLLKFTKVEEKSGDISTSDRFKLGRAVRDELRREFKESGSCAICGFCKALCEEPRLYPEPEQSGSGEVATLGVPT